MLYPALSIGFLLSNGQPVIDIFFYEVLLLIGKILIDVY